ncbi:CheR family methyltransferase [Sphingomonas jatrophae]|uniref:Chemotaxis protein methyltransferase CheR n=1 Tax=Sphingomonas jatrophae TaxID=1166337 RepID=A0A1I6L1M7_9SPHN|nr:CheR family methyltransferase [Sphingomonas jatrophae]SFR97110.1 chemotaxis protein methyltransferase CheR [Sphingomonas jatrophae]
MSDLSPASTRVFSAILEARTGQQISPGRRWRIDVALAPLLRARGWRSLEQLAAQVGSGRDPALAETVVEALLNNETSFFRDPAAWTLFATRALPGLIEARTAERRLRLWSAGCATGQEAFSLAMLLADEPRLAGWSVDIVATDVSRAAIDRAREGLFSQFEIQRGLPAPLMLRWFEQEGEGWRAVPALRRRIRFHHHSLLEPAPAPARFDAIFCRNVLFYFADAVRTRAFDRLAGALAGEGVLMLGAGETVIGQTTHFASDAAARGLYRRTQP